MTTITLTKAEVETVTRPRSVERLIAGLPTSDGAGVKLTRVLTQELQRRLDPFLMLDAFGTDNPQDYIGGFPDHPHRGFETVTYMTAVRHETSAYKVGVGPRTVFEVDTPRARLALSFVHRTRQWTIDGLDEERTAA